MKVYKLVARLKNNVVRLEKIVLSGKVLPVEEKFVAGENYPICIYQDLQTIMGNDYPWFMENHTMFAFEEVDYASLALEQPAEPVKVEAPVSKVKSTVTINAFDLRLSNDTHDDLSDFLEVSNGSSHRWNPENGYFKKSNEVNAALVKLGVDLKEEIYLLFSW